MDNPEKLAI